MKNFLKFLGFQIGGYIILASLVVELLEVCDFPLKNCKIYLGPMLSPGCRNWQLIYPNSFSIFKKL
jgi:hypothetical protein